MRRDGLRSSILVVARLKGFGVVTLDDDWIGARLSQSDTTLGEWQPILTTEDRAFTEEPSPPTIDGSTRRATFRFTGPAAMILMRESSMPVDRIAAETDRAPSDVVDVVVSAPRPL